MKCWTCEKDAHKKCTVCGAHYCSEKCQKEDWKKHKLLCYKYLHERLRAVVENRSKDAVKICIRGNENREPFTKGNLYTNYCMICEEREYWIDKKTPIISFKNFDVEYQRCAKCFIKGSLLMPNFLPHDSELLFVEVFLCLREKGILKDLIKHVLKYVLKANKKIAISCKKKDTGDDCK
jgi:hypothetical protein